MTARFIAAQRLQGVRTKADGTAIALEVQAEGEQALTLEIPADQVHALMRELLGAVGQLPPEDPAAQTAQQAFTVTGYGVGTGFPESVVLALRTPTFGQQGFALDPESARAIADELRNQADQLDSGRGQPH